LERKSPTRYQILEFKHHQQIEMVDMAASLRQSSQFRHSWLPSSDTPLKYLDTEKNSADR
jgi:hypothetical protein